MTVVTIVFCAGCVFLLADAWLAFVDPRRYVGAPERPTSAQSAAAVRGRAVYVSMPEAAHFGPESPTG